MQMRKLRMMNERLAQDKIDVEEKLADIQKKTMATVTVAVEKTRFLQSKLFEAKTENASLVCALEAAASLNNS